MVCHVLRAAQKHFRCAGLASEGSRHGGQSWTEELIAQNAANSGGEEEAPKSLSEEVEYPAVERKLRSWYYQWVSSLLLCRLLAAPTDKRCCSSAGLPTSSDRVLEQLRPNGWMQPHLGSLARS